MSIIRTIAAAAIGSKAQSKLRGRGLLGAVVGIAVTRVATRSLPGALLVGGGLLAKTLYDKSQERQARAAAE